MNCIRLLFPANIIPHMFKGRTLKLKLFDILQSIDIDVSVRRLSMSIYDKRLEFNYYVHFGNTFFGH